LIWAGQGYGAGTGRDDSSREAGRLEERKRRAKLRLMVKRILRKYGYPPDKQDKATKTVLEQAELIASDWAG